MRTTYIFFFFFGCGCLMLAGCSKDVYSTAPVEGMVTYQGMPVTWGNILFTPKPTAERTEGAGRTAVAGVDEQGSYRLSTYGKFDGAVTGMHGIQFQYAELDPVIIENIKTMAKKSGVPPPRFLRPKTPTAVVEPGRNKIDIELVGTS